MNPAEPLTRTFCIFTDLFPSVPAPVGSDLRGGQAGPEREAIPAQVTGIHLATLKFDTPAWRSSQIVGISATGSRIRRALAVSSMPSSKPSRESMPTARTKSVEYALNEFVASRVPMCASSRSDRPAA